MHAIASLKYRDENNIQNRVVIDQTICHESYNPFDWDSEWTQSVYAPGLGEEENEGSPVCMGNHLWNLWHRAAGAEHRGCMPIRISVMR